MFFLRKTAFRGKNSIQRRGCWSCGLRGGDHMRRGVDIKVTSFVRVIQRGPSGPPQLDYDVIILYILPLLNDPVTISSFDHLPDDDIGPWVLIFFRRTECIQVKIIATSNVQVKWKKKYTIRPSWIYVCVRHWNLRGYYSVSEY